LGGALKPMMITNRQNPAKSRRHRNIAVIVLLAVGLHVAAIEVISRATTRWSQSGAPFRVATLELVPLHYTTLAPAVGSTRPHSDAQASPATATSQPRAGAQTPGPPAPQEFLNTSATIQHAERFYRSDEVDQPATPDSDWNLDAVALDSSGINRLVFEIFVDGTGRVVGCTILEPRSLNADTRRILSERLSATTLQSAMRQGQAVASVRRIEMTVSQ
jgi:hypothetical protein